jgi:hypothetical protein
MGELLGWEEKHSIVIVINMVELSVKARGLPPFASFKEKSSHPRKVTDCVFVTESKIGCRVSTSNLESLK